MKLQKDVFRDSEADRWFERNFAKAVKQEEEKDQALASLLRLGKRFERVLEIGCADGWRLNRLRERFGSRCVGVEPSQNAVDAGRERYPGVELRVGTADALDFEARSFDLVIAGFCLCLCDRQDLFRIATEFDRVLEIGGTLLITDFLPPVPYKNDWRHVSGVYCYKMDYASMFLWNPQYTLYERSVVDYHSGKMEPSRFDGQIGVSLLLKGEESVYSRSPYADTR